MGGLTELVVFSFVAVSIANVGNWPSAVFELSCQQPPPLHSFFPASLLHCLVFIIIFISIVIVVAK